MPFQKAQFLPFLVFICVATLQAQTLTLKVEPGKETTVAEDKQEIKVTTAPKTGIATVEPPSAPDQTFKLLYRGKRGPGGNQRRSWLSNWRQSGAESDD